MRMVVEFGATFNQADLASNKLFLRNQEFNTNLTIPNPYETEVVTLTNPVTNISVSTVVARQQLPK
jgi:hypothetical protein